MLRAGVLPLERGRTPAPGITKLTILVTDWNYGLIHQRGTQCILCSKGEFVNKLNYLLQANSITDMVLYECYLRPKLIMNYYKLEAEKIWDVASYPPQKYHDVWCMGKYSVSTMIVSVHFCLMYDKNGGQWILKVWLSKPFFDLRWQYFVAQFGYINFIFLQCQHRI